MGNIIVVLVIFMVISLAIIKVVRDKKMGVKCSGCPHAPKSKGAGHEKGSCACPE